MPNNPNTSFIPKQGPVRRPRQTAARHVHLLSVFAYIAFASSLVASVGVFFYQKHVEKQLEEQVGQLDTAISSFSEEDMTQVRGFHNRLTQAKERLESGVSIVAIFEALENALLQTVSLEELKLARVDGGDIELEAKVRSNTFDSALFQRGVFERSDAVSSVEVKDLALESDSTDEEGQVLSDGGVSFIATLGVSALAVPNVPREGASIPDTTNVPDEDSATSTASSTETVVSDEVSDEVVNEDSL